MFNFFHKLFHPHCPECARALVCKSCETLKIQLDIISIEKKQLLETIISLARPEIIKAEPTITTPIFPKVIPWHKRKHILEEEDRISAHLKAHADTRIAEASRIIEKVEKEIGLADVE